MEEVFEPLGFAPENKEEVEESVVFIEPESELEPELTIEFDAKPEPEVDPAPKAVKHRHDIRPMVRIKPVPKRGVPGARSFDR